VQIKVPLSYTPVRVISDIDDTVKTANILAGARAIFYTVFVQDLVELVIPGMGDWYDKMWRRGARFHYVVGSFVIRSIGLTVTLSPVQWTIRDPPHTQ
jgi:phosphatidate phosphatase APP1